MEEALRSKKNCVKIRNGDAAKIIYAIIECHKLNRMKSNKPKFLFRILQTMTVIQGCHTSRIMSSAKDVQQQIAIDRGVMYSVFLITNGLYLLKYAHGLVAINEDGYGIKRHGIQIVNTLNTLSKGNEDIEKFTRSSKSRNCNPTDFE